MRGARRGKQPDRQRHWRRALRWPARRGHSVSSRRRSRVRAGGCWCGARRFRIAVGAHPIRRLERHRTGWYSAERRGGEWLAGARSPGPVAARGTAAVDDAHAGGGGRDDRAAHRNASTGASDDRNWRGTHRNLLRPREESTPALLSNCWQAPRKTRDPTITGSRAFFSNGLRTVTATAATTATSATAATAAMRAATTAV